MVVVGKHFAWFAYCGLVVDIQIHLTAIYIYIYLFAPRTQGQPRREPAFEHQKQDCGIPWVRLACHLQVEATYTKSHLPRGFQLEFGRNFLPFLPGFHGTCGRVAVRPCCS